MTGTRNSFAYLALLNAATLWGLYWYPLRILESAGMPPIWVTLVAYTSALSVGLVLTLRYRKQYVHHAGALLLIALSTGWCNASFTIAVVEGTVARVILLFYLSPVWTLFFGYWILRERLSARSIGLVLFALFGALVMLWKPGMRFPWPESIADWLALSSGLAFALGNVLVRRLQQVTLTVKTSMSWLGGMLVSAAWILLMDHPVPDAQMQAWWGAVALGAIAIVIMTLSVQYGVTHMPVHKSAIILLFEIVVGALSAYLLANESLSLQELFGGVIIISSAILASRETHEPEYS